MTNSVLGAGDTTVNKTIVLALIQIEEIGINKESGDEGGFRWGYIL